MDVYIYIYMVYGGIHSQGNTYTSAYKWYDLVLH